MVAGKNAVAALSVAYPEARRAHACDIGCRQPQDQPTTERQGLRSGKRAGKRLQLCTLLVRQGYWGSIRTWHGSGPCLEATKQTYISFENDHPSPVLTRQKTGEG